MENSKIQMEEVNLEDLIILGEENHIPITIEFPKNGKKILAKALIKPLTLKLLKGIKLNKNTNLNETEKEILARGLLKQDGTPMPKEIIEELPIGVLKEITNRIMEISGVEEDEQKIRDF